MTDHHAYLNIRSRCGATFDLSVRLPDQVFREIGDESLFCEFDRVLTPEFWPALSAMARWHGDEHVELLVLEPDCDGYYLSEYQSYPALSLSVEAGEDDYWALIWSRGCQRHLRFDRDFGERRCGDRAFPQMGMLG
ncbi:hypothetical protein [Micromonospora sp. NPDC050695]|uniref:hypothetical protein n=1 Tax=Micromonospora sp. NPDC050695 TaxID=3154938 RepID=UPI0033CCCDE6